MSSFYGSSFEKYLLSVATLFRDQVVHKWMTLALGWVLQTGRRTTAGLIRAAGPLADRSFSAYYKFFRTDSWSTKSFWKSIQQMVFDRVDGPILVGIDDTLWHKVGRSIEGCGWYPSKKSLYHRSLTYVFGQCWVCLTVSVPVPFSNQATISVPVMARLYKPNDQCEDGEFQTRLQMVNEMLSVLAETAGNRKIRAVADSFYGGQPLLGDLPESVEVIVRLKRDSQLYEIPNRPEDPGPGRPRKKGEPLDQPHDWIEQHDGWATREVHRYGTNESVRCQTQKALWYYVTGEDPGRIVVVKENDETGLALYSTDPTLDPVRMIEFYARRWTIETVFREAKQVGGAEDPQCQNPKAVRRQTPFNLGLMSLVKLWFLDHYEELEPMIQRSDWEKARAVPSFRIMLQVLRWRIRKQQFSQKWGQTPNLPKKIDNLFNQWIRAA